MGKITGFMEIERKDRGYAPVAERVKVYKEFVKALPDADMSAQGARCMDCGIPFCQTGCPVNNIIPDWNDLVYRGNWKDALKVLHSTNNFPEFTGRVCPAPCEASCTLNINNDAVAIKSIEQAIVDKGWKEGWIGPIVKPQKSGKKVAVVGSGPAGLAASQQLARAGHDVTLFEKNDRFGGLLRYGIPDFKMEKDLIDKRMEQMRAEGVTFKPNSHVGVNLPAKKLVDEFDAVVLTGGSEKPRDLPVTGRELSGIYYAMDFLPLQNKKVAGDTVPNQIVATGKHVVVIGGGDTGSDCIGTSIRQGAKSVMNFELMPQPPEREDKPLTWPYWPLKLRTSSSHEEGAKRDFAVATKSFNGKDGKVESLTACHVEWVKDEKGGMAMKEVPGTEFTIPADLVLLAMGYLHPVHEGMIAELSVAKDGRGNVKATTDGPGCYATSVPKVFAAGDMRRGQSLVVWAIREGRQAAREVDAFLMGSTSLPR
ncbi:Glutamate synthase [NADPH] small chain [Usitatibacter rugosus]|uniref:Glutamate synthase [NADPH] small chain n=1 Tax=Usitatibacter rugosus TaxID=2732067 RepID=A0A6M4H1C5_9PROT|nr:glutamate synthase subunit beta [Usitatibacter rugosus]QJR13145.1 Glutamate synthase [NADPH] small chain [Usitatibacter rugosus]